MYQKFAALRDFTSMSTHDGVSGLISARQHSLLRIDVGC